MVTTILLADDQVGLQRALRIWLEQARDFYLIGEVKSTDTLLAEIQDKQPDILLLDWELPGLPITNRRKQLLQTLRRQLPHLRIVALSSWLEAKQPALAAGVDAFVSKTDPPDQLLAVLRQIGSSSMHHP